MRWPPSGTSAPRPPEAQTTLGLASLVPAMVGVVYAVTDLIFDLTAALIVTIVTALTFLLLSYRGSTKE